MSIEELVDLKLKDGKFRLQNRRVFFTYKTHLDKESVKTYFSNNYKAKRVEICHESGDETVPYLHSHVYVDFGRIFQTTDARKFDLQDKDTIFEDGTFGVLHPNIQYIKSAKHEENVLRYMGKEDPECANLVQEDPNYYEMVMAFETRSDMLRNCVKRPGDALGLLAMWNIREQQITEIPDLKLKWQVDCEKFVTTTPPENRNIWWYFDKQGKTGKSEFVRYMIRKYPKDCLFLNSFGRTSDAMLIIQNAINSGWTGKIMLVDLARSFEDRDSIFTPLENVKNGLITSTKYNGSSIWMNTSPHIICFANFMPKFCAMSADRWRVGELQQNFNEDGSYQGEPFLTMRPRHECEEIQRVLEWERFCAMKKKEEEDQQMQERWEMQKRGFNPSGPLPTYGNYPYQVNYPSQ